MSVAVRDNAFSVIGSLFLHAVLVFGVLFSSHCSFDQTAHDSPGPSIEAVAVDSRVLQAVQDHRQAQASAEQQRRAEAEAAQRAQQAAQEQAQRKAQDEAQAAAQAHAAEQARVAEQQQEQAAVRREAAQASAAKAAAARTSALEQQQAAQQRALAEQQAAAQAAADAQAARKKLADERARSERESELRRQLADEEHVTAVENSPLRDRYIASIQNRITRAWLKPESAHSGIVCRIEVTQIPGGEVTQVSVTDCNGDEAVRQSIENAVYRASPLPEPPDPALFQRDLTLVFKPNG